MRVGVIGGGPAGMSASLWLKQFGFEVLLIDRGPTLGGLQCANSLLNQWVLGHLDQSGQVLAGVFADHIRAMGVAPLLSTEVLTIEEEQEGFSLTCVSPSGQTQHSISALILALGTRIRGPEIWSRCAAIDVQSLRPEQLLWGPRAFENIGNYAGQRLLVIGAGDNAHEFVILTLGEVDTYVMLARSARKAQKRFKNVVDQLIQGQRCQLLEYADLIELVGIGECVKAKCKTSTGIQELKVDAVVLLAGYEPESSRLDKMLSPALDPRLKRDAMNYLVVDQFGRTACRGIYAAGDVINPVLPCVSTAIATGAIAAKSIERDYGHLVSLK